MVRRAAPNLTGWLTYQRWLNGPLYRHVISRIENIGACRCPDVDGPHRHYRRSL